MKSITGTVIRAFVVAVAWGAVGAAMNFVSAKPAPWIYEPPRFLDLDGVRVQLIDEKQARDFLGSPDTVFVDSRKQEDYAKSHVKGSIFLAPDDAQERFVALEPLLPQHCRIVLYCYGPECDMAEEVAVFLVQMGYKNLAIMSAGYAAWEKAGYPVETSTDHSEGLDFWEQEYERQICCEIALAPPRPCELQWLHSGVKTEAVG